MVTHFGENKFGYLNDVAIAPSGEIVIVDDGNKCVVVLNNKLNLLKVIGQGSGSSRLVSPDGVAVTGDVIAVSDYSSDQVKKSRLTVVSREAKKKQHACASSGPRDHYSELFTRMAALKF